MKWGRTFAAFVMGSVVLCSGAYAGVGSVIEQQDYGPVFSPDGSQIAFRRIVTGFYGVPGPHAYVMPTGGGPVRDLGPMFTLGSGEDSLSWTPDGKAVVFGGARGVTVASVDGSSSTTFGAGSGTGVTLIDTSTTPVSRGGWVTFDTVAPAGQIQTISLARLDGSDQHVVLASSDPRLPSMAGRFWSPTFSPDGQRVAFIYGNGVGSVWSMNRDGSNLQELDSGTQANGYGAILSWSRDGSRLVYLASGGFHIVDARGAGLLYPVSLGVGFGSVSWSPDDNEVLLPTGDGYALVALDGSLAHALALPDTSRANGSRYSSWSPDGATVALNASIPQCRTTSLEFAPSSLDSSRPITADCRITGTRHADRIFGNELSNLINGLGGNDVIHGGVGDDTINGGGGNDTIYGDAGPDLIFGGAGNDTISVRGGGIDFVSCGAGRGTVYADKRDRVSRDCERVIRR